jgi:type VI secretion system protein ImpA
MTDLAAPIPGDKPGGIYLKSDRGAYRALRNAFNAAQSAWRAFSETPDTLEDRELERSNAAAWAKLSTLAEETLTTRSKDLEIFCWYVGAQVHAPEPLPATQAALEALAALLGRDIEALQPIPPDEKLRGDSEAARAAELAELKLRPFVQLFGEVEGGGLLYAPLTNLQLAGNVTYGRFLAAERAENLPELIAELAAELPAAADLILARADALNGIVVALDDISGPLRSLASLHGLAPPSSAHLERHLKAMQAALERLTEGHGLALPGAKVEAPEDEAGGQDAPAAPGADALAARAAGGSTAALPVGSPDNREAALSHLAELARYFRAAEPHSPVYMLIERAVRWGRMPANELYREILGEGSPALGQMSLMTGMESDGFCDGMASGPAATEPASAPKPPMTTVAPVSETSPTDPQEPTPTQAEEAEAPQPSIAKFEL